MGLNDTVQGLLDPNLSLNDTRILVQNIFDFTFTEGVRDTNRSKTFGASKSLLEFHDLVRQAINDDEEKRGITSENRILFTEEEPDESAQNESIVFNLLNKVPGAYSKGPPNKGDVRNRRPIIREEGPDPEHPGYRLITLGFYYDSIVRYTCWARTNKAANARSEWFEDLMESYTWWFRLQGVNRVLYEGQATDLSLDINGNKWYGRPIDYFVRTDKLRVYREKELEEILLRLTVQTD